jgi:hypothetical protein
VTNTMGAGFSILYTFPGGGPCFLVRVAELFDGDMNNVLRYYTARYGQAAISEPKEAARAARAAA